MSLFRVAVGAVPRQLLVLAAVLIISLVGLGWYVSRRQAATSRSAAEQMLASVVDLKSHQIEGWIRERRADASLVLASASIHQLLADPQDSAAQARVREYSGHLQQAYDYDFVAVFDAHGTLLLTTSPERLQRHGCVAGHVQTALHAAEVVVTELHRGQADEPIHFSLLCPIRSGAPTDGPAMGVVLLAVDPYRFLYPFLQHWPLPNETGETLLVRRDGQEVVYLNETRHRQGMALNLRLPESRTEVPAVRAALGEEGLMTGPDYRGLPVVALARAIAGTSWVLVAKLDQAEIDAPIRSARLKTGAATGLAALVGLLAIGLLWRQQRLRFMQQELAERERGEAALRAREELFSSIVNQAADAIALLDGATGKLVEFNAAAHEGLGYTRDEFARLTIADIQAEHSPEEIRRNFALILQGGGLAFETRHRRRDGAVRDVRVSVRALRLQGRDCMAAVWSDITDRKRQEAFRALAHEILRILSEPGDLRPTLARVLGLVKAATEVDAAGIRLQAGDDFPYFCTDGLEPDFVQRENSLQARTQEGCVCRNAEGRVCLACLCGRVVSGAAVPDHPLFTPGGSFWTNDAAALLELPPDQAPWNHRRSACFGQGYASMALIPIRAKGQVIGLLQLNDRRKDRFTREAIEAFEDAARTIGEALQRKRAEIELRESQEQLRQIIATAQDAIVMMDPQGRIRLWNQAAERVFGYASGEAIGQNLHHFLVPQRFQEAAERGLAGFQQTGTGPAVGVLNELVGRRRDGTEFPVELSLAPVQLGGAWHAVGILRDITKRKRAEERLRKVSEVQAALHDPASLDQKLQRITDAVVEIFAADFARIWLIRRGDRCEAGCVHAAVTEGPHVCRQRERCLHLAASSGRYTHRDGPGHGRVPFGCYKIGRVASGQEPSFLTNDVTVDPRVHNHEWAAGLGLVSFAGYQLRPSQGETIGVLALFSKHPLSSEEDALLTNLSELVVPVIQAARAEEKLRASEAKLRRAQAVGHIGSWQLDAAQNRLIWSDEMHRIFGVPAGAPLTYDTFRACIHPDDRAAVDAAWQAALQGEPYDLEHRIVAAGEVKWIRERVEVDLDARGRLLGGIGTAQDITERKQTADALQARNEELVRFAYTVSHDLKSPLVTIQSFLGFLEQDIEKGDAERMKTDFGYLRRAATKMLDLLEELLELSRVGRKMNPPEDVAFTDLVRAALDAVAGQVAERRVQVDVAPVAVLLRGDRPRLTEVFQNLLDNAVKFLGDQPAPRIEVGVEEAGPERVFYVRDNGLGIDPRHQGKLFGLFEKLHPGLPGTGMGLALVKRIVEVHGGRIWAESAGPGQGATFRFTLPNTRQIETR